MTEQTAKEIIHICKDRNIKNLISREVEVVTTMMSLLDNEQIMKTYWKDMENTFAHKKDRETAKRMIRKAKKAV